MCVQFDIYRYMSYCIDYVIMAYYQRYQISRISYLTIMTTSGSILSLLGRHIIIESHKKDCMKLLSNNVILYFKMTVQQYHGQYRDRCCRAATFLCGSGGSGSYPTIYQAMFKKLHIWMWRVKNCYALWHLCIIIHLCKTFRLEPEPSEPDPPKWSGSLRLRLRNTDSMKQLGQHDNYNGNHHNEFVFWRLKAHVTRYTVYAALLITFRQIRIFAKTFRENFSRKPFAKKRRNFAKTVTLFAKVFVFAKSENGVFVPTLIWTPNHKFRIHNTGGQSSVRIRRHLKP
jgi:hypothetical protein